MPGALTLGFTMNLVFIFPASRFQLLRLDIDGRKKISKEQSTYKMDKAIAIFPRPMDTWGSAVLEKLRGVPID